MPTTRIVSVLNQAQIQIQDKTGTRWPPSELLSWYNMALQAIVTERPDANVKNTTFSTVIGTKQSLPADGLRLIDIPRNEGGQKKPIRVIDRMILDDNYAWHNQATPATEVLHYVYDDRDPKTFYLYPAPAAAVQINLVYSTAPVAATIANFDTDVQVIGVDDNYVPAILDYILYRAYQKDASYAGNENRAASAYGAFRNSLGIKTNADQAMSPNRQS